MAGIYLHIPFCKSRCIYCDFYTTTDTHSQNLYVEALIQELKMRKEYLKDSIKTIYIGGGTPSLLSPNQLEKIFNTLFSEYNLTKVKEVTLEANPDDLNSTYLKSLQSLPINRLSIGIQSFNDKQLKALNRRHSANQALDAVKRSQDYGFQNISIDLIYGLPNETIQEWEKDIEQAIQLDIQHLSAYHLIYEENTPLFQLLQEKKIEEVDEDLSVHFFSTLIHSLKNAGFEHYEISNFCKKGYRSQHNSSYWDGSHYMGCGPSAHSYNGASREWNVSSLTEYIKGLQSNHRIFEVENLDLSTRYNDYIITALRRCEGIDLKYVEKVFGEKLYQHCLFFAQSHINSQALELINNNLKLTHQGIFISDGIMSDLLFIL
ncbi:MAG: radical SAM family heme chaperone HemW [Bacteroidales bacterium]|nr:radical SAM family heme chaperone HemW [Bacteroidales bacterium]